MIDERFLTHRLRSTSIAGMAGVAVTGGMFFYRLAHHVISWDLFAIVATMAVVKMSLMLWYHFND